MSIFHRPAAVERSVKVPPEVLRFTPTDFSAVNPTAGLAALQSVAIWATADLIASMVSELPVDMYAGRTKMAAPGNIDDPGGDGWGREDWLYRLIMSWLIRGNAYGSVIDWDSRWGRPQTVALMSPMDVRPVVIGDQVSWYYRGKKLSDEDLARFEHWRVYPQPGMLLGQSVIEAHATSIGVSLRSAQFGDQWFREGAHPSGMLVNKAPLSDVNAEQAKKRLKEVTQGNRDPLVLGEGWEFANLQISPEESQFVETQRYAEAQCARMFGPGYAEVLGYESGGSMTYANVVDRRQDLLVLSLNKWVRRADRILTYLLPPSTRRIRLDRDALLEATTKDRYATHALALAANWKTVNEVRDLEDMQPVPWGDEPFSLQLKNTGASNGTTAQS